MAVPQERDYMKNAALAGLWAVLMLVAGWGFIDARDARAETRQEISTLRLDLNDATRTVAVLQETITNQKEALARLERGVNEILARSKSSPLFNR